MFLLALIGCNGSGSLPRSGEVISPRENATISAPWVPLLLRLNDRFEDATFSVRLDGQPLAQTDAVYRRRWSGRGEGWDYLGYLDLRDLAPGTHRVEWTISRGGRENLASSTFNYRRLAHRVGFEVRDDGGALIGSRVRVFRDGQPYVLASSDMADADPSGRDVELNSVFLPAGEGQLYLDPGDYRFVIARDMTHEIAVVERSLADDLSVQVTLPQVVAMDGWISTDLHVHSGWSSDAFVPSRPRFYSLMSAGIDVIALTDHNKIVHPSVADEAFSRGPHPVLVQGVEARIGPSETASDPGRSFGHLNAFPVVSDSVAPLPSQNAESVAQHLDHWRGRVPGAQTVPLIQLNHPRGIQFFPEVASIPGAHPLFNAKGFDPARPLDAPPNAWLIEPDPQTGTVALDFDAIEVINRFSFDRYRLVREDWFALLNAGRRITGTGNSDSHSLEVEQAGFPLNWQPCESPVSGVPYDLTCFRQTLQRGQAMVTTGPLVFFSATSGLATLTMGDEALAGVQRVNIEVKAASWVPVQEVRLIQNGRVIRRQTLDAADRDDRGVLDKRLAWDVQCDEGWLLVEAGWPIEVDPVGELTSLFGHYSEVAPGYVPMAFTNPIYCSTKSTP